MVRNLMFAVAIVALAAPPAAAFCFQDQYGNQYDFVLDKQHGIITGEATADPDCDTTFWNVFGSFSKADGKYNYELTVINPLGESEEACFSVYKIKGQWPAGNWYYSPPFDVYSADQPFTWDKCSNLRPALATPQDYVTGQKK